MAVAVNDVFAFALVQKLFGQEVVNTFAMKVKSVGTITDEVAWLAGWFEDTTGFFNSEDRLRDELRQQQSTEVTHERWLAQRVTNVMTAQYLFPVLTNKQGALAFTCETANVAMSIERKGGLAGRRQRGRIAVAGIPTTRYAAGLFTNEALVDAAGLAFQMQGDTPANAALGVCEMGFWSPGRTVQTQDGPIVYLPLFIACKSAQARETVRVQRSRTVGRGN